MKEWFWKGKGRSSKNPKVWVTEEPFWFGTKHVPAGVEVKQFETRNFGITIWKDPTSGRTRLARY